MLLYIHTHTHMITWPELTPHWPLLSGIETQQSFTAQTKHVILFMNSRCGQRRGDTSAALLLFLLLDAATPAKKCDLLSTLSHNVPLFPARALSDTGRKNQTQSGSVWREDGVSASHMSACLIFQIYFKAALHFFPNKQCSIALWWAGDRCVHSCHSSQKFAGSS